MLESMNAAHFWTLLNELNLDGDIIQGHIYLSNQGSLIMTISSSTFASSPFRSISGLQLSVSVLHSIYESLGRLASTL